MGVAVGDDDRWSGWVRCRVHWLFSVFVGVYGDEEENRAMLFAVMRPVSSVLVSDVEFGDAVDRLDEEH